MEKTTFQQLSEWLNDLKRANKKTVKVQDISEKFDSIIKDKVTVDIQLNKELVKFEGMTQTQSDTIAQMFQSYLREFEEKKKQTTVVKNDGFELIAEWSDDESSDKKDTKKKSSKFRGKIPVTPTIKNNNKPSK